MGSGANVVPVGPRRQPNGPQAEPITSLLDVNIDSFLHSRRLSSGPLGSSLAHVAADPMSLQPDGTSSGRFAARSIHQSPTRAGSSSQLLLSPPSPNFSQEALPPSLD